MNYRHLWMAGLLLSLNSPALWGQETFESADEYEVAEVVVKEKKDLTEGETIDADALDNLSANDLEDVFRHSPEVMVGGGQAAGQKIYVRGVEDVNLNVTIDGARQSAYLFHHQGRLNIEPELLKKVEVAPGSGSALAGPGALGGAIRMTTKDASDMLEEGETFGSMLKLNYASSADEQGASAAVFGKAGKKVDYLLYGTYSDIEDYRAGGGDKVKYTGARPKSILAKTTFRPSDKHKFTLNFNRKEDNATRTVRPHFGYYEGNDPMKQEFVTENTVLNYDFVSGNPLLNLSATVFNTENFLKRHSEGGDSETTWDSQGIDVNNLFLFNQHEYTLGVDYTRDHSVGRNNTGDQDELGEIFGIYQQFVHQTSAKLTTTAGLRYDHYSLIDVAEEEISQSRFSPSIAFDYAWTDAFKTSLSWAEAFKGVTPAESLIISSADGVAPVDEKLKGTTSQTVQLGAVYDKGNQKFSAVVFHTEFLNFLNVDKARGNNPLVRSNGENLVTKGYSLSADFAMARSQFGASFTSAEIKYDGEHLGNIAFEKGSSFGDRLNLYYTRELKPNKLSLDWNSLIVFDMNDVPDGAKKHPGYDLHTLSLRYNWSKRDKLVLAIHNIFDEKYIAHSTPYRNGASELYEPGRDARIEWTRFF